MAEAALKEEIMPEGGIADFIRTDEEIAAMDADNAKREFGESGIANFQDAAVKMASYGRFGDDKLVHAETGELIVPKALIEDNPDLKESIFGHLREMGIEDPERYVVGSDANSLNPDTGLPEFFLKKIFKGVRKAFKSVGKVLKKAAPLILPVVLGPAGLGLNAIYAGALGGGLGTLIQGGSMKDALKAGLLGGAAGAVFTGVTGSGSFGENISGAFSSPVVEGSYLAGLGSPASPAAPTSAAANLDGATQTLTSADQFTTEPFSNVTPSSTTGAGTATDVLTKTATVTPYEPSSFIDSVKSGNFSEAFFPSGPSAAQVAQAQGAAYTEAYNAALGTGAPQAAAEAAGQAAMKNVTAKSIGPNMLRTYGPLAAAGTGLAAATGFFDTPEEEPVDLGPTGAELLAQDPEKYTPKGYELTSAQGPFTVGTSYGYTPRRVTPNNPFGVQYAEDGGEIFPRRVGGIMPDEGVPGKDSVRAMLMPGEFVMTTNAVKGLGNGNLNQGINNMYDMMRGLEARGKAIA